MNLVALLREFGADEALIALVERWIGRAEEGAEALTDDELVELREGLVALASDEEASYALLEGAADVVAEVVAEDEARETAAREDEERRERAAARLRGEPEADSDADETESGDEDTGDEDATEEGGESDDTPAGDEEARQPVTAAVPARRAPRARRDALPARNGGRNVAMRLLDGGPGDRGGEVDNLRDIDRAFTRRHAGFKRSRGQAVEGQDFIPVAQFVQNYPADRILGDDPARNARIIEELLAPYLTMEAMAAAGGYCAPFPVIWDVPTWGDTGQPVRDATPSLGAPRGGMVSINPPSLPQVGGGVTFWTEQDDIDAATDPDVRKTCYVVPCGDTRTAQVKALVRCLEFGVLRSRTFGEWDRAWTNLTMVFEARMAEQDRLTQIEDGSLDIDDLPTVVSAVRDVLNNVDAAAWGIRSRFRLGDEFPFRAILPSVWRAVARRDIANSLPGGSLREHLTQADAILSAAWASRNINVTYSPDLNVIGPQAAGTELAHLPPTINAAVYPEGHWIRLDSGELDLGLVRDSELIKRNAFLTFFERWETMHSLGLDEASFWLTMDACPSGGSVGTIDPAGLCASYT